MTITSYRVVRPHEGDRAYTEGQTRQANPADVAHLIPHVLEPIVEEPAAAPVKPKAAKRKAKA